MSKKKHIDPKETKPDSPYLAVWFEIYKIGDSVKKKTNWEPKAYTREPKCYYFPAGYTEQEAIDEIHQEYGKRDGVVLHQAHSFAMIHGLTLPDKTHVVLPIR